MCLGVEVALDTNKREDEEWIHVVVPGEFDDVSGENSWIHNFEKLTLLRDDGCDTADIIVL